MGTRRYVAAGLLLAVGLLTGCGAGQEGVVTSSSASPSSPASPSGSASPSPSTSASPTGGPIRPPSKPLPTIDPSGGPVGQVTLRGVVEEGVEGNCKVFKADNGIGYQLIGVDPKLLAPGTRLEVTGTKAIGMASICMQGELFRVASARRL